MRVRSAAVQHQADGMVVVRAPESHRDACPVRPCALGEFLDAPFAAVEGAYLTVAGLKGEALEVAEMIVDQSVDLAGQVLVAGTRGSVVLDSSQLARPGVGGRGRDRAGVAGLLPQ